MAIAKPVSGSITTVVSGLLIKPPYTVVVKSPVFPSALPSGYKGFSWDIYLYGTREEDYDPATQTTASKQTLIGILSKITDDAPSELKHYIELWGYYTGGGSYYALVASGLTLTDKHEFRYDFSGCNIKVTIDGTTYLNTNMFKPPLPLFEIGIFGQAVDSSGSIVAFPKDFDVPWEIDVVPGIDISAIFEQVIPVVISFATGMAVMGLLMKALGSATAAIGRA